MSQSPSLSVPIIPSPCVQALMDKIGTLFYEKSSPQYPKQQWADDPRHIPILPFSPLSLAVGMERNNDIVYGKSPIPIAADDNSEDTHSEDTVMDSSVTLDPWSFARVIKKIKDGDFKVFMNAVGSGEFSERLYKRWSVIGCDLYTLKRGKVGLKDLCNRWRPDQEGKPIYERFKMLGLAEKWGTNNTPGY